MIQLLDLLTNTWNGWLFVLVVVAMVWGLGTLFALVAVWLVSWWNWKRYEASEREMRSNLLQWKQRQERDEDLDAALYRSSRNGAA